MKSATDVLPEFDIRPLEVSKRFGRIK